MSTTVKGGKGKKKTKEKKEPDPNRLKQVDRQYCELTITDLNQKVSRLRSCVASLEEKNANLTELLRSLEEDRVDVASHLQRTLIERDERIQSLEERLLEVTKVRDEEGHQLTETIQNMEAKYKAMHDQLTSEIKLLNGKLNSLDEFRIQRDVMLAKFEDQESVLKRKDQTYKETIYNMEQRQVVEKDALKKEVEAKLLQVSEDFTRSSEIRNAGYTRRLIRENIALQKEIDIMVLAQIKIRQESRDKDEHHKQLIEEYSALCEIRDQLLKNAQNKMIIVEQLTEQYEKLKSKYIECIKYRSFYEKVISRDVCERFNVKELKRKLRFLAEKNEMLKREKKEMAAQFMTLDMEKIRLRTIIDSIKLTLQSAVTETGKLRTRSSQITSHLDGNVIADEMEERKNLLSELINILASHTSQMLETPSLSTISEAVQQPVYKYGKLGFIYKSKSTLLDVFRRPRRLDETTGPPKYVLKEQESKMLPKERINTNVIIDPMMGEPLYASSSHEDLDLIQAEENDEHSDDKEVTESSDMQSLASEQEIKKKTLTAETMDDRISLGRPTITTAAKLIESAAVSRTTSDSKIFMPKDTSQLTETEIEENEEEEDFIEFFY